MLKCHLYSYTELLFKAFAYILSLDNVYFMENLVQR